MRIAFFLVVPTIPIAVYAQVMEGSAFVIVGDTIRVGQGKVRLCGIDAHDFADGLMGLGESA